MGQKKSSASWLLEIGATYVDKRSREKASTRHAVNRIGAPCFAILGGYAVTYSLVSRTK